MKLLLPFISLYFLCVQLCPSIPSIAGEISLHLQNLDDKRLLPRLLTGLLQMPLPFTGVLPFNHSLCAHSHIHLFKRLLMSYNYLHMSHTVLRTEETTLSKIKKIFLFLAATIQQI